MQFHLELSSMTLNKWCVYTSICMVNKAWRLKSKYRITRISSNLGFKSYSHMKLNIEMKNTRYYPSLAWTCSSLHLSRWWHHRLQNFNKVLCAYYVKLAIKTPWFSSNNLNQGCYGALILQVNVLYIYSRKSMYFMF